MIGFDAKKLFFDKAPVLKAMDAKTRAALSKAGAFIRQRARTSMRRRKTVAPQGQPPSAHAGQLRDLLYFAYDPATRSVVVGPQKFGKGTVPRVLEEGGKSERSGNVSINVSPHPYMGPALQAELPNLPSRWSGSVQA
jgi:hypothetical protein